MKVCGHLDLTGVSLPSDPVSVGRIQWCRLDVHAPGSLQGDKEECHQSRLKDLGVVNRTPQTVGRGASDENALDCRWHYNVLTQGRSNDLHVYIIGLHRHLYKKSLCPTGLRRPLLLSPTSLRDVTSPLSVLTLQT